MVLSEGIYCRDILVSKKRRDQKKVICFQLRTINTGQDRTASVYFCSRKITYAVHWHNITIKSCLFSVHLFLHWSPFPLWDNWQRSSTSLTNSPRNPRSKTSDCLKTMIRIADTFIGARKGQGTALVKASIIAFPMSRTSLLQGQKMERVRCGKTGQLFTLPARSYQIAFLSCQQNKLTSNRRTLTALCQGDRHILFQKKRTKQLPQDQITSCILLQNTTAALQGSRFHSLHCCKQRKGFFKGAFPS